MTRAIVRGWPNQTEAAQAERAQAFSNFSFCAHLCVDAGRWHHQAIAAGDTRMNTARLIIATTMLALAGAAHAANKTQKNDENDKNDKNEARLAQMLEGRTAGEPVSYYSAVQIEPARSARRRCAGV